MGSLSGSGGGKVGHNAPEGSSITLDNGSSGNTLTNNTASQNQGSGIVILAGSGDNLITGNTALQNHGQADLVDVNPGCDSNTWQNNHFGTAFPSSCIS